MLTVPISHIAVDLFFTLSGFLVAGSLIKRGVRDFAVARALRMIPGLWVMLIVTTLLLGLLFGSLPFGEFLQHPGTARFVLRNGALLGREYGLPGVFTGFPFPVVNGSLWDAAAGGALLHRAGVDRRRRAARRRALPS